MRLTLKNQDQTTSFAIALGQILRAGDIICLEGPLGAGKSTFARALIQDRLKSAGIVENHIPSPTFTFVERYQAGPVPIYHFDLYRLEKPEDARELGLDEALDEGILLIEWASRAADLLPIDCLVINLDIVAAVGNDAAPLSQSRTLTALSNGAWDERLASIQIPFNAPL